MPDAQLCRTSRSGALRNFRVCVVLPLLAAYASADLPFAGVNAGAPIWNGSILLDDALAADIAGAGCRAVRVNFRIDGHATWTPQHLAKYDAIIAAARARNLQVLGIIAYESLPGTQAQWNENYNTTGLNPYVYAFAETAWLLINRYKDDVKLFEIWNEPNCWSVPPGSNPLNAGCYYIWPRIYANILAETYKRCLVGGGADFFEQQGIALVTGGLFAHDIGGGVNSAMPDYMNTVYGQSDIWNAFELHSGRRYPWDYFGYHFYIQQGEALLTSRLAAYFQNVRFWKSWYGDTTPIMVTEFGWNTQAVSAALQAENLTTTYDWLRAQPDVVAAYWYQWNDGDGGWGLTYSLGNPKLAYYAFAAQCGQVNAPVADFTATPLVGAAPLPVVFRHEAVGLIDSHLWDFGDGATSTDAHPTYTYNVPGNYDVTLTVTGPGGADTLTRPAYVRVGSIADLDGNGAADLHDVASFALCYNGAEPAIPDGCACEDAPPPAPVATHTLAPSLAALPQAISASDLLHGRLGTREAGGFHAATPGGDAGGLTSLTDGVAGSGAQAVLADYSRPALQVRYDFEPAVDLGALRVFSANADGRVFQYYDVWVATAGTSGWLPLVTGVATGGFGQVNSGQFSAGLTEVVPDGVGPLATRVAALRLVFYGVSTVDPPGVFWDPWDASEPEDVDGQPRAYVAPILKEVDVFAYDGPPLLRNAADLNRDGSTDHADVALLFAHLTGPHGE